MSANNSDDNAPSNARKDPATWTTGDEEMTGAPASYLKTPSDEAGEDFDELQKRTGRGIDH